MPKYRFLGCNMLLPNGTWFSALPMFGTLSPTDPITTDIRHPWNLSRDIGLALPGGKAIKWWHRLLNCTIVASGSIYSSALSTDVDFAASGEMVRANVLTEHDVLLHPLPQQNYYWTGGSDAGDTQRVYVNNFELMSGVAVDPFFITNTHISPDFVSVFTLDVPSLSFSDAVRTVPAFGQVVVGTLYFDSESVSLYATPYPTGSNKINFMDITVTPSLYLTHDGTYDPATGLYASGVPTNKY